MQLARWIDIEGRLPLLITAGALVLVFAILGIVAINRVGTIATPAVTEQPEPEIVALTDGSGLLAPGGDGDVPLSSAVPEEGFAAENPRDAGTFNEPAFDGRGSAAMEILATHEVESGETLYGISRKHYGSGRYWRALANANQLGSGTIDLSIGQALEIPTLDSLGAPRTPASRAKDGPATVVVVDDEPTTPSATSTTTYSVQPGDTLWSIATSQLGSGVKWQQIAEANPGIDSGSPLRVGQNLVIPE